MAQVEEKFGEWLRRWRSEKGLTQEEAGRAIGVSKQHISNLERGQMHYQSGSQARASIEVVDKLAKLFGRPISEARDAAGYGLSEAPSHEHSEIARLPEELAELTRIFLSLSSSQRKDILAMVKALYQPTPGIVLVDDVDLKESDAREVRKGKG